MSAAIVNNTQQPQQQVTHPLETGRESKSERVDSEIVCTGEREGGRERDRNIETEHMWV